MLSSPSVAMVCAASASSGSTETQQCRRKYSLGGMVRAKRSSSPNFSTRSSSTHSHHGTQLQLPSRNAARKPGKRAKTPPVNRLPSASISSMDGPPHAPARNCP